MKKEFKSKRVDGRDNTSPPANPTWRRYKDRPNDHKATGVCHLLTVKEQQRGRGVRQSAVKKVKMSPPTASAEGHLLGDVGVARIGEDSAHTTDSLRAIAVAAGTVLGGGVNSTGLVSLGTLDADVTALSPSRGPGVSDEVVKLTVVLTVSNKLDGMVNIGLLHVTSGENTGLIEVPSTGVNGDGDGTDGGNGLHEGGVTVVSELGVSRDLGEGNDEVRVAVKVLSGVADVRVDPLGRETSVGHDAVVGDLSGTSRASTGSTAVLGVRGTRGDLLLRELNADSLRNKKLRLESLGSGKSPTRTALSLILDGGDSSLLSPVHAGRESVKAGLGKSVLLTVRDVHLGHSLVDRGTVSEHLLELLGGEVGKVRHTVLVGKSLGVVLLDGAKVVVEDSLAGLVHGGTGNMGLAELGNVLFKVVLLGLNLVPAGESSGHAVEGHDGQNGEKGNGTELHDLFLK